MFGVAGNTLDAMMRASTRRALASADVVVNVPLRQYGSLDWRRASDLIAEGYRAAEAMRDQLLPLAVPEADFEEWRARRQARRRTEVPAPAFVQLDGFATGDAKRLGARLARHVGVPLDVKALEAEMSETAGLDRYETVTWRPTPDPARGTGLLVRGRIKPHAPPFMMLGLNLENITSREFRISASARYLAFDVLASGSELRIDGTIGTEPSLAVELYRPVGRTPLFVAPRAGVGKRAVNLIEDDDVVARYEEATARIGLNVGINLGARSDVRVGGYHGRTSSSIEVGNPGFPELRGNETGGDFVWRLDTQDSPVIPAGGVSSEIRLAHVLDGPDVILNDETFAPENKLTQLSAVANHFWSAGPHRVFVYAGFGTSFESRPLSTQLFELGTLFRLGAYDTGEIKGRHYYIGTAGYFRRMGRLPDFMGGPIFAGGWVENGDAFDEWSQADWKLNGSAGLVLETLVGPVVLAGTGSIEGRWRTYVSIGRTFR
jgi:NTE family protein